MIEKKVSVQGHPAIVALTRALSQSRAAYDRQSWSSRVTNDEVRLSTWLNGGPPHYRYLIVTTRCAWIAMPRLTLPHDSLLFFANEYEPRTRLCTQKRVPGSYSLERSESIHDNCWRLSCKTHIHWYERGRIVLPLLYKLWLLHEKFTTTLRINVVFSQSRGNTRKI
jgi:hypothetical protein